MLEPRQRAHEMPSCAFENYTGQFFAPNGSEVYRPGDTVDLSWHAGRVSNTTNEDGSKRPVVMYWWMVLQHMRYEEIVAEQGQAVNYTAFEELPFVFDSDAWFERDLCGNTEVRSTWTIPQYLDNHGEQKFVFQATGTGDGGTLTVKSNNFTILDYVESASSASSVESASPTSSSGTSGTSLAAQDPTQTDVGGGASAGGISSGAVAGIAVAAVLVFLAALGASWFLWRRRRRLKAGENAGDGADSGYQKPELDGQGATREKISDMLDGTPVAELDNGVPHKGVGGFETHAELEDGRPPVRMEQPPVEMDAQERKP